jgi:cytochrome c-type biogenesis protein CcmH
MALWLVLPLMTAAALVVVVLPLVRGDEVVPTGSDVAVKKDQLAEIDRDLEIGLIGKTDADAARGEVSRRLLQAAEISDTDHPSSPTGTMKRTPRLATLAVVLVILPTLTATIYLRVGSPNAASFSVADEAAPSSDDAAIDAMVTQVEDYLKDTPNDGRGWEALAPVYMRLGRYEDAVRAWQNTIANLGDSADREENLGESLLAAADGAVTKKAKRAFDQALSMDPNNVAARFYTGLAAKQEGRRDEAAQIWRDLIAKASPDAEWADTVRDALAGLDEPSVATADSATSLEHDSGAMHEMVERLAERLHNQGGDADSWFMLVRSYEALGERGKASDASARARLAFASDPERLAIFDRLLRGTAVASGRDPVAALAERAEAQRPVIADPNPAEQQMTMIKNMVDRLAQRLQQDGHDVDGWMQLMRSYVVLGQRGLAIAANQKARLALSNDVDALRRLDAAAKELGVE